MLEPGLYYVAKDDGWQIKEWDGEHWWIMGWDVPEDGEQVVIGPVPEPGENERLRSKAERIERRSNERHATARDAFLMVRQLRGQIADVENET